MTQVNAALPEAAGQPRECGAADDRQGPAREWQEDQGRIITDCP